MAADITSLVISVESKGIKEASQALSGLGTSAANAEKRINALIEATKKLNVVNDLSAKSADNVILRLREQDKILSTMAANSRVSARGTQDLAAAMSLLAASMNLLNQNTIIVTRNQRMHNESMREAHALARGLSGSLGALWLTYGNFAGMAVGVGIGASLKGIVSVGKDVEHTLEGIRVRGNETVESVDKIRQSVYDLGKGVYGPQEVAKAFEVLILAGLRAEQALSAVGSTLNLAVAGGVSIEKAASTLVSVGTAVGYTAEAYNRVGDIIAKTAALSMSSVESLSESFKSASSVASLYGLSLEDIGTSLGILSNLGIKGTASGTALKNMYKELASESDKVKGTFKQIGIEMSDFKDAAGNFKPLLEVVQTLDQGLSKLSGTDEKLAIARVSNERGLRLLTEALEQYRKKTGETTNALGDFQEGVTKSYGFMAMAAAQLSLTAESQMKSVVNSLKVGFAQAFKEIEPEVIGISQNLRDAFQSEGFKDGIRAMATLFANLAAAIANNLPIVVKLAEAFLLVKASFIVAAVWHSAAAGITAVAAAIAGTATAAAALNVAMGAIGIALGLATLAWVAYSAAQDDATKAQRDAESYNKGYIEGIRKEAEELEKVNQKMREGLALRDAKKAVESDNARQLLVEKNIDAVEEARKAVNKAQEKVNNPSLLDRLENPSAFGGDFAQKELTKAKAALNRAEEVQREATIQAFDQELALKMTAQDNNELSKLIAQAGKADREDATATLAGKPNKAAENDEYAAAITKINAKIKAEKKAMLNYEENLNEEFKAGEIGKLQVIEMVAKDQVARYSEIGKLIDEQIDKASKGKNKLADMAKFEGLDEANTEAIEQAKRRQIKQTATEQAELRQASAKDQVKQFEEEGSYVKAAALRWSTEYAPAVQALQKDFEKYGDTIPEIKKRMDQLNATQKAFMESARVRELSKEFDELYMSIGNGIKGVQTASEDQGLAAMFSAAQKATEDYKNSLPALQEKLEKIKAIATAPGATTAAKTEYQDELSKQKSLAEKYKTMWTGVGKSISDSLTNAFGKGGKAAGGIIEAITKYHNTDNKSLEAKTKLYGDVAESAKGFFSEGSKGYQIMDTVSKAFHAAELARTLAGMAPKIASGVASLFAQGGWAGFAGAAAFLALMAGLGFSGGGSAPTSAMDRQKNIGTGSVLGDSSAKSDSIQKSLDSLAKDSGLGLVHFNSMDKSLKTLVNNIEGLSSLLVRGTNLTSPVAATTYGNSGLSSAATSIMKVADATFSVIDKLTGGLSTKITAAIFGGKTSVEDVGLKLTKDTLAGILENGATVQKYTDIKKSGGLFSSSKYSTQTENLGDEVNNQFALIISNLSDTVKSAASMLGLNTGEFEKKLSSFVIDIGEISTKGMTGEEIQAALETAFSKLGDDMAKFAIVGLDKFQKVGEGYLETVARVANELVQVQDVFAVLGKTMTSTGVSAVQASQDFINLFGSIDKLTESTDYFVENFLSDADKLKPIQESLTKEMNRLGLSSIDTIDKFKNLVLQQDLNTKSGQEMYAALMNLAPAFKAVEEASTKLAEKQKEISDKQRELDIQLMEAQGKAAQALNERRKDELDALSKLSPALAETQKQIWAIVDAKSSVNNAFDSLSSATTKAKNAAQDAYNTQEKILNAQITTLTETKTALDALSSALDGAYKTITGFADGVLSMSRDQAKANLDDALNIARKTGRLPTADDLKDTLSTLTKDPANSFSSYAEYIKDIGITAGKLSNLKDITDDQGSVTDKQLATAKSQLQIAKDTLDLENKKFDAILGYAQSQLDATNGTTVAVLNLTAALAAFNTSINVAIGQLQQVGVVGSDGKPISSGIATDAEIAGLYESILGRKADSEGLAFWSSQRTSASVIAQNFLSSPEYLASHPDGSHAGGLDYVPKDNYIARLHKGEKVLTAQQAKSSRDGSDLAAVVEAIDNACKETTMAITPMQEDIRKLYKRIVDMSPSGDRLQTAEIGV